MSLTYGDATVLSPRVRRLVQQNPGLFTGPGTNTYLIGGTDELVVLDPGEDRPEHLEALRRAVGATPVRAILVTHGHADHWPLAAGAAEAFAAPVMAFAARGGFRPDRTIADGERIEIVGTSLRALHTPGHASDHLAFLLEEEQALFCGDHVMSWSTSVIAPPDGNLRQFLASLERLLALDPTRLYPGHGDAIEDPRRRMLELRAHRQQRTEQALRALGEAPGTPAELVRRIYTDVDPKLHPAAQMSLLAHLDALIEEGRVASDGIDPRSARYRLREPS